MGIRGIQKIALLIAGLLLLFVPAACNKTPVSEEASAPAALPTDTTALGVSFENATRPPSSKQVASLNYAFKRPLAEPVKVSLTDPKNPPRALCDLGFAILRITPQMLAPKILPNRLDECWVQGCYVFCLRAADGMHLADFEINAWGALILIEGTVQEGLEFERVDSGGRTLYVFYNQAPGGGYADPRLAVEYQRDAKFNKQQYKGTDDWLYHFEYPDGQLLFHRGDGLEQMRDRLAEAGAVEKEQWAEYAKDKQKERQKRSCSSGGG